MKKINIVIIVVMCVLFFNNIYASQNVDIEINTNKNKIEEKENIQVNVILKNLDSSINTNNISCYIDYDKAVFEEINDNDILINNRYLKDSYNKSSKKVYTNLNLNLTNNCNILTINFKVRENVKVSSGYISLKQLCIIDVNYNKFDFSDKSIKFDVMNSYTKKDNDVIYNISQPVPTVNIAENMKDVLNFNIGDNISKVLSIPLEGTWIIFYSFMIVILFRLLVGFLYKGGTKFLLKLRQINTSRRINKIFKSINSKMVE